MRKKIYRHLLSCIAICMLVTNPVLATADAAAPRLDCTNGPVARTFGSEPWLVFACSDGTSMVVVSDKGNKSHPSYFMLYLKGGKRFVVAEGSGSKAVTAAAYQELEKLSETDIATIISAAMAVPKGPEQQGR